jgi:hypothetical protein
VSTPDVLRAFDEAIAAVRLLAATGLTTARGDSAAPELARLLEELTARRAEVVAGGPFDREWAGQTVRWVAGWVPERELPLLARLGGIARAATPR